MRYSMNRFTIHSKPDFENNDSWEMNFRTYTSLIGQTAFSK